MSTDFKPWHSVPLEVSKGVKIALLHAKTRARAIEFCHEMADKQGGKKLADNPAKWLENIRKEARKTGLEAYKRAQAMQQYHWHKLVREMRQLESKGWEF